MRHSVGKLTGICLVLGICAQAWAQVPNGSVTTDELMDLIKAQDSRLDKLEEKPKPKPVTQKWTGRVHFDYWGFPSADPLLNFIDTGDPTASPRDFTGFRRLRFGVAGDIYQTMEYKIEMEWAVPEDPVFKDAYLGWNELPWLQTVLLGNQKRPYGLDHLNSSRYNVFLERPFHVEAFNQDTRRIGVCSYGTSYNDVLNWRYGYFIMDDLSALGGHRSDNYLSEIAGRLASTLWYDEVSGGRGYAHAAISGSVGFPGGSDDTSIRYRTRPEARSRQRWIDTEGLDANRMHLLGFEGVVNVGALQVVGEYQVANVNRINGLQSTNFDGYYIYVAYFLTGEHTPWSKSSGTLGRVKPFENFFLVRHCDGGCAAGWGAWQIAARYSYGDFSDADIFGGEGKSFTLGLNWWWTPNSRMQFNYIHGRIEDRDLVAGIAGPQTAGDYDIFGARFMVDF